MYSPSLKTLATDKYVRSEAIIDRCYYLAYNFAFDISLRNVELSHNIPGGIRFGMSIIKVLWKRGIPSQYFLQYAFKKHNRFLSYKSKIGETAFSLKLCFASSGLYFCSYCFSENSTHLKEPLQKILSNILPKEEAALPDKIISLMQHQPMVCLGSDNYFLMIRNEADGCCIHVLNLSLNVQGFLF